MKTISISILAVIMLAGLLQNERIESDALKRMGDRLNESINKEYEGVYFKGGFYVEKNVPINFFVFDLVDTSANIYPPKIDLKKPVTLSANGVYHFAPWRTTVSFSHIAVIKNGRVKIFSHLNCVDKGDDVEDVLKYVKANFDFDEQVLNRITTYRKHGVYASTDAMSKVDCNQAR